MHTRSGSTQYLYHEDVHESCSQYRLARALTDAQTTDTMAGVR
jgi:hypothetical protein